MKHKKFDRALEITRAILTAPLWILSYFVACIIEAIVEGFKAGY